MKSIKLTIFTPTYNRADTLWKLYDSLKCQTSKEFVWLIIDDGSSDNTSSLVNSWLKDNSLKIIYKYQENQGKSSAFNHGLDLTETELFTCVDSDDYLSPDAVSNILATWAECKNDCVGILSRRAVTQVPDELIGRDIRTTLLDAYRRYHIEGDTMLIHRSDIIKKYRFPKYDNEKFVPEDYLYDKIDKDGKLFFLNKTLYLGNYLDNGYTSNMAKLIKNNPKGYLAYIEQRLSIDHELKYLVGDIIRYIAIKKVLGDKCSNKIETSFLYYLIYPLGLLFYNIRYKNI